MRTIRWILVLPAAILAPVLIITVLNLFMIVLGAVDWRWSFPSEKGVLGLMVEYAFFGGLFVLAGSITAPHGRKIVSILLASVFYAYFFLQVFLALKFTGTLIPDTIASKIPLLYGIAAVVGASLAVAKIFKNSDIELTEWLR